MVQQVHHKLRLGLFTVFSVAILLPAAVSAQSLGELGGVTGDAFALSVSPQYPAPYSQATVSLLSSSLDLTNATLAVSVGGKEIYKGAVRPFTVALGKAGGVANVKVTVSSGGTSYNQTLTIQPQDVVLIAEPISSAPPLYLGKSLVPIEGDVRVVAMASMKDAGGKSANPSAYSYAWTVDGVQIANSSGIGRSSIIVASPLQYRARSVSVAVASSGLVGGSSLSLTAMEPSLLVYENDPLLGIRYNRALLGNYKINGTESTLFAAPFSLPTTGGPPLIKWFLNGSLAQTGNSITMRPTGSGEGGASLSLTASSGGSTTATAGFSVSFGKNPSTNFFGL